MQESLLHFIWQHALYDGRQLVSTDGQPIVVLSPGRKNEDEGPDFCEAKIRIDNIEWIGSVEIHIHESDWLKHQHQHHPAYQNIILHIVYHHDLTTPIGHFPTLDISPYITEEVLLRYQQLAHTRRQIPCHTQLPAIPQIVSQSWLSRLLIERWQTKYAAWDHTFQDCGQDYQALLYLRLAYNFGFKINSDAMIALAASIPYHIVHKLQEDTTALEAIAYGQAGLLPHNDMQDEYAELLQKEYDFYRQKLQLEPSTVAFKWLRLRPTNFPTIRISQWVQLLSKGQSLFHLLIKKSASLEEIRTYLNTSASSYWHTHYQFGKVSKHSIKTMGASSVDNIVINTIAPFLFYYGQKMGDEDYIEMAVGLLAQLPPEHNAIIKHYIDTPLVPRDAQQSQSLIQLYNNYCSPKRCLDCAIGVRLMKQDAKG